MTVPGTRHLGLKIISVVIAALLWLVVSGDQVVERAVRVPLEYTNLPAALEIVGSPPEVADLRVRGSSGALSRMAPGELVAVLDVEAARPGQRLFHLAPADVRAPFGVEVVQVSPTTVAMDFEPSASKTVPVVPSLDGLPADGFAIGAVRSVPAFVEVVGPATMLESLTQAMTEPVSVAGADRTRTAAVPIGLANPSLRIKGGRTATVTVIVKPVTGEGTSR